MTHPYNAVAEAGYGVESPCADGSHLIARRTITGFANVEEDEANRIVGQQIMPWRIQDGATERGANAVQNGLWMPFAVRDGRLITGQQQDSGAKVAELLMKRWGYRA